MTAETPAVLGELPRIGPMDVLLWPSRGGAVVWINRQDRRSRRHMRPVYTAAWDGWLVEWHRTDGHMVMKRSDGRWGCPSALDGSCRRCDP